MRIPWFGKRIVSPRLKSLLGVWLKTQAARASGGMDSAVLNGVLDASRRCSERCEIFALAKSPGSVESRIDPPAIMTHASIPAEVRAKLATSDSLVGDSLVRLSVGIEDIEDLIEDLESALA